MHSPKILSFPTKSQITLLYDSSDAGAFPVRTDVEKQSCKQQQGGAGPAIGYEMFVQNKALQKSWQPGHSGDFPLNTNKISQVTGELNTNQKYFLPIRSEQHRLCLAELQTYNWSLQLSFTPFPLFLFLIFKSNHDLQCRF